MGLALRGWLWNRVMINCVGINDHVQGLRKDRTLTVRPVYATLAYTSMSETEANGIVLPGLLDAEEAF